MHKLRELWNSDEKIQHLEQQVASLQTELIAVRTEFAAAIKQVHELRVESAKAQEALQATRDAAHHTSIQFAEELDKFKVMKRQLQTEFLARGTEELQRTLKDLGSLLQVDQTQSIEIKKQLLALAQNTPQVLKGMEALQAIIQTIRKEDFQFDRVLGRIQHVERERSEFLRKIDSLERAIAHRRRHRDPSQSDKNKPRMA